MRMKNLAWMFAPKGKRFGTFVVSRYTGLGGMLAAAAIPAGYRWWKRRSAARRSEYGAGLPGAELAAPTGR